MGVFFNIKCGVGMGGFIKCRWEGLENVGWGLGGFIDVGYRWEGL